MEAKFNRVKQYKQIKYQMMISQYNKSTTMLKKKNYKQQQHFNQLHTFSVLAPATATQPAKKYQIYYKRYRQRQQSQNLYNLIHGDSSKADTQYKQQSDTVISPKYSQDRTLELISFDGDIGFLKKYLRKIGKIRQYQTGEGLYKGQKINTAMCVFKFQFDLVKCFRDQYLQTIMDQQCLPNAKNITEQDREQQRYQLIQSHMGKQLRDKVTKLKQMQQDGFQVVTDIYGQYRMDFEANKKFVQDLPQIKKEKKRKQKERKLREELDREKNQQI